LETIIRILRTISISIFTVISGTLCVLIGWYRPGYYLISRYFWAPGLLWTSGIRVEKSNMSLRDMPPCIFFANHRSHFDIPILMYTVPRPLFFLAKKELKSIPFLGWGMAAVGMVFIDRKDRSAAIKSMDKAGVRIRSGKSIVTFPEGTRSSTRQMLPLKKGGFHLAKSQGIPLMPVAISGSEKVLPKRGKLRSGRIKVKMGEPIMPDALAELTIEELKNEARRRLESLLAELETSTETLKAETH